MDHDFTYSHINYELLKKDYYRKRKRKNIENNLPLSVPGFFPTKNSIFLSLN
jgi:hypothetical protein